MSDEVIEVRGLTKRYGDLEALRGVDLRVDKGEVFALLGPNGAGKTTAVEVMEGHRTRSGGDVRVLGFDPARRDRALKQRIGIVLQSTAMEPYLTVEEVIEMYRGYYPHPRPLDEIIELVGLHGKRSARVKSLSGGQQRRLDVAIGLAGDPELLFLDEPTTGFDPSARRNAWEVIKNLASLGKTVFLTTHYMEEAQTLADRVAIIVDGRIIAEGPPGRLIHEEPTTLISFRAPEGFVLSDAMVGKATYQDRRIELRTSEPVRDLHELTAMLIESHAEVADITVTRPSLEDVYLRLTEEAEGGGAP